jgi:hypothetical protein
MLEPVIKSVKDKLSDLETKARVHGSHLVAGSVVRSKDKVKKVTEKDRLISSALLGLTGLAGSIVVPKIISRFSKQPFYFSLPAKIGITAAGATSGYFGPDVRNTLIKEKRGKISKEKAIKILHHYSKLKNEAVNKLKGSFDKPGNVSEKTAGLLGSAIKGTVKGVGGLVGEGLRFGKKRPLGTRIWSGAFKAGLLGGGIYGANKMINKYKYRSGPNYTTFLRNQTMAGNIRPEELTESDLVNVRNLGMR